MLPKYLSKRLKHLETEFGKKVFTTQDAYSVLSVSKSLVYVVLHQLHKRGLLRRVGKGMYTVVYRADIEPSLTLPDVAKKIESILNSEGIHFVITGIDVLLSFVHHLPVRYPHLVYTEKGSSDWVKDVLSKADFKVLADPKGTEISLGLELAPSSDLVVIRETSNFYATKEGKASLERALVDLYFEVTRENYPLMISEVGRIFYTALRGSTINFSRLVRYARRRKIEPEVKALLEIFSEHIFIPSPFFTGRKRKNKNVETIQATLEAIAR